MVKYLMVFVLICGLSLIGTAEAKEVKEVWVSPVTGAEVVVDEADIRLGGDVRVRHINLSDGLFGIPHPVVAGLQDESWIETRMRLLMEADLADNVAVVVRLSNNRAWGKDAVAGEFDAVMDWAYFSMENVAGHPIDLIIGRQPIALGDSMQIDDDFDAVRLSIPFEPVVVDAFFAKIQDADPMAMAMLPDDDLIGFHIVYLHPEPAIAVNMGYYELIERRPDNRIRSMAISGSGNLLGLIGDIPGIGGLGIGDVGLLVDGGIIFQTGNIGIIDLDADALYFEIGAAMDMAAVGLRYASLSGDDPATAATNETFQPMFEDVEFSRFLEELEDLYATNTNLSLWGLGIEASPMEGVTVALDYTDVSRGAVAPRVSDDMGTELRIRAGYALTEDVRLGLETAEFSPGAYWASRHPAMTKTGTYTELQVEYSF